MRRVLAIAVISLAVAVCGPSPESATTAPDARAPEIPARRPATVAGLVGAWQPVPYQLDPVFRARAETTCRADLESRGGPAVSTIDARGGSVVVVRVRGADMALCNALRIQLNGAIDGAGSGQNGPWVPPPPAGAWDVDEIQVAAVEGGDLKVEGWVVHGRAGPGIRLVIIRPDLGAALVATLENGYFAGWWPAKLPQPPTDPRLPGPHFVIQAYDAGQDLRTTYRP